MAKVLTAPTLAKMKAKGNLPLEVPDASSPGLYAVIYPSGKKSWAFRFRRPDRRSAKLTLGSCNLIGDHERDSEPVIGGHLTLTAARRLAATLRHQIALGQDPAAVHQAARRAVALSANDTFASAARDFVSQYAAKKRRDWREQARMLGLSDNLELIEKGLTARWRDRPLVEIDDDDLFGVIEESRHRGVPGLQRKNADASEPRARAMHATLSVLFAWLLQKRKLKTNPMTLLTRPSPPAARDRVLNNQEIMALWRATAHIPKPFAAVIKLLILTGCRRDEVSGMEVKELSADLSSWTIPGSRTKNKRAHVVPLPPLTRAIIAGSERSPTCRFIFSTNQKTPISGWSKIKARLDLKMKDAVSAPWVLHDLRRTAATGMADIGVAPHVIEATLNHVSGAKAGVAGTYNRSSYAKEKAEALKRWAEHIVSLVGDAEEGECMRR